MDRWLDGWMKECLDGWIATDKAKQCSLELGSIDHCARGAIIRNWSMSSYYQGQSQSGTTQKKITRNR